MTGENCFFVAIRLLLYFCCIWLADTLGPQVKPTLQNPFIFFHQRKSGGTAFRNRLFESAQAIKIDPASIFIACFLNVSCDVYSLDSAWQSRPSLRIVGGHMYYGHVVRYLRRKAPGAAPACFTIMRSPLDRILSCLSYRRLAFEIEHLNALDNIALLTCFETGVMLTGTGVSMSHNVYLAAAQLKKTCRLQRD